MSRESRIYVGNLPATVRAKDVEDIFSKYGRVLYVDLKDRRQPYFAFVEFEDARCHAFLGSWQDLKDHMREAGDVCYTDVLRDGTGIVEYSRYEDMKYALRKLDDTKFKSHEGETSYIRVKEDNGESRAHSRSRSPVGRASRGSPQYSPSYSNSGSRSRSP
uniref:RRM domain-containing protein n=1 Tax=Elaeophora elaphi TaxID=1147741 RepID=A0A0R3RQA8_9BILA